MTHVHRGAHRVIWLILLPVLLIAVGMALGLRPPPEPEPQETQKEAVQ
jgi:hypothetical protein